MGNVGNDKAYQTWSNVILRICIFRIYVEMIVRMSVLSIRNDKAYQTWSIDTDFVLGRWYFFPDPQEADFFEVNPNYQKGDFLKPWEKHFRLFCLLMSTVNRFIFLKNDFSILCQQFHHKTGLKITVAVYFLKCEK